MADTIDPESLIKREGSTEIPYSQRGDDWPLRKKVLFRKGISYSNVADITRFNNNLNNVEFPWGSSQVMLPDCTTTEIGANLSSKTVYKVNCPGFLYMQRWSGNNVSGFYDVYIDGDATFSNGPKYMKTLDVYPDENRKYYTKSGSSYIEVGTLITFNPSVTYYEKFDKTYFLLFSSENGGVSGSNMFPICPGKNTHIWIKSSLSGCALAYMPAAGFSGGLSKISSSNINSLVFNAFSRENARYVFNRS